MNRYQGRILQWARRVRDFLGERDIKIDIAELTTLKKELDDAVGRLTVAVAAQEAITKQARVQTTEINRLRDVLRNTTMKPIVRMSHTMKLQINGSEITFVLPDKGVDNERLAAAGDAMVTALNVVGPQFVARGFTANFVEQLSSATKALRDAIDVRSAQLGQRTGTTAGILNEGKRTVKLVRVIDSLVRPAIANDPEVLATWNNVVALRQSPKSGGAASATTPAAAVPAVESNSGTLHPLQAA